MKFNASQLPAQAALILLGAVLVKGFDVLQPDSITVKRITVVDDNGKTTGTIDAGGVQMLGAEDGSYTLLKAGDKPQLTVVRDGGTVAVVGENWVGTDGVTLFRNGQVAGAFTVNNDRAVLGILNPTQDGTINSVDDILNSSRNYAMFSARGESVGINLKHGESRKDIVVPEAQK